MEGSVVATRKYEQRERAEGAEETKTRVLEALYERLRNAPAQRVSVEQVARDAGVARNTVYLAFGSRPGLFAALGASLLERGGFADMLAASADADGRTALRKGIDGVVAMYAANRDVLRALHSMAQLDPDAVGGSVPELEYGRASGARLRAERLAKQGLLRADVTIEEATNLLWVLMSFESFDLLYTGRALTVEATAQALTTAAERGILA